jgi:hypothetical protein
MEEIITNFNALLKSFLGVWKKDKQSQPGYLISSTESTPKHLNPKQAVDGKFRFYVILKEAILLLRQALSSLY